MSDAPPIPDFPMQGMSRDALVLFRRHLLGCLAMVDRLIVQSDIDMRNKDVYIATK